VFLNIINSSLVSGSVPAIFKHAVVQPLIKNANLNPNELNNYRPISKLSFLSKILEKAVLIQLQSFLIENLLFGKFQSGLRKHHSTESTLLKVLNDILLTVDSGNAAVLVLLDLSAGFRPCNSYCTVAEVGRDARCGFKLV